MKEFAEKVLQILEDLENRVSYLESDDEGQDYGRHNRKSIEELKTFIEKMAVE